MRVRQAVAGLLCWRSCHSCGDQCRRSVLGEARRDTCNSDCVHQKSHVYPISSTAHCRYNQHCKPVMMSPRADHVDGRCLLKSFAHVAFQICSAYLVGWCRASVAPARHGSTATSRGDSPRATASSLTCRHVECAAPVSMPALTARWSPVMTLCPSRRFRSTKLLPNVHSVTAQEHRYGNIT